MHGGSRRSQRGVVLIIVLAVLLVLALLATVFVTLQSLEKAVSHNYVDDVRAKLAAQAGVEHAIVRIRELLASGVASDRSWEYFGDVTVETNPPHPAIPIEHAANPSFAWENEAMQNPLDANTAPRTLVVEGKAVGFSGTMESGTYGRFGDQYALRVTDCTGQINVNDGVPWGANHSVSQNLRRILNVLGAQPGVQVPDLGDAILNQRPATGYRSKYEILGALGNDTAAFQRVRDLITTHSWTDRRVANPVPVSASVADPALGIYRVAYNRPSGLYRYGHNKNFEGKVVNAPLLFRMPGNTNPFHHAIYGVDSLHPQWIEIVARSPVNLNTARREVLLALLVDLEGFFVVERRRDAPYTPPSSTFGWTGQTGGYAWLNHKLTYDFSGAEGDECGFLYRTVPIVGPGGQSQIGVSAAAIADEILACREKRPSPGISGLDYGSAAFGGPFRTWAQFNRFVDRLVQGGVLVDNRPNLFFDYDSNGNPVQNSAAQRRIASQAIADVLKANFNPNLHLNELNPDRTLFTHVDKTDLIVNSTEFCFTPMGVFEIESLGRVLSPTSGDDALVAPDNRIVAEKKILAVVKLFDAERQTAQSEFYAGEWTNRTTWPETNNNRSLETGPEPDNGPQPSEAAYSGYLALPTIGGNRGNSFEWGTFKPKNELWTTYPSPGLFPGCKSSINGGAQFGSLLHAHFQLDAVAHHHNDKINLPGGWDGFKLPLGGWWLVYDGRASIAMNWEDRTEPILSPYTPVDSGFVPSNGPNRYRLGRAFVSPTVGSTGSSPAGFHYAPSDLRVDGIYCERHSAIGYWLTQDSSFNFSRGTVAFWVKPNFFPECTGKPRTLLSMSRYHNADPQTVNPSPFTLFFFPAHDAPAGVASAYENPATPSYYGGIGKFRPASLAFGIGFHPATGYNWETGGADASLHANVLSPTLNHEVHGPDNGNPRLGDDGKPNYLRGHEWTHIAVTWNLPYGVLQDADSVQIYVNGQVLPSTIGIPSFYGTESGEPFPSNPPWYLHALQVNVPGFGTKWANNAIRIGGEISKLLDQIWGMPQSILPRNYSADMTIDEFYLWNNDSNSTGGGLLGAQTLWYRGRYYKPSDANADDAVFTSAPLTLASASRWVPGSSAVASPDGMPTSLAPTVPPPSKNRVVGLSWTAYAEDYDAASMEPRMYDYSSFPPLPLVPANGTVADLWMVVDGTTYGPYHDEGYSPVTNAQNEPVEVQSSVQYRGKLKIGPKTPSTVLLATPVLDDVTIYFDHGEPEIVGWLLVNTSRP